MQSSTATAQLFRHDDVSGVQVSTLTCCHQCYVTARYTNSTTLQRAS